jgi:diguanylate cyclase (GGDEF)-like protein/PAS domain S-box-containing protein
MSDGVWIALVGVLAGLAAGGVVRVLGAHGLYRLRDLLLLGAAGLLAGALSAALLAWLVPGDSQRWPFWWLAMALGILLPAPGLACVTPWRWPSRRARWWEAAALLSGVLALTVAALTLGQGLLPGRPSYLLLPLVVWVGLRFGLRLVSTVSTLVAAALIGGEFTVGWQAAAVSAWPVHVLTVSATVAGLMLIDGVALQEEKRRLGARRLQASEEFVKSMLTNSPAVVTVMHYDREGRGGVAMVSPAFATLLSMPEEDVVGRSWTDLLGAAAGHQAQQEDLHVLGSGTAAVFVTRLGPRGRRRTLMTTKFPLRLADPGMRAVGMVALDVTEHRRRDRIMRLTFDLSPVPMARMTVQDGEVGVVLDANAALGDLLGVPSEALRGQDLRAFLPPGERDVAWAPDVAVEEGSSPAREVRMVDARGRQLWAAMSIGVVHAPGDGDDEAFALAVVQDVSSRHEAEQTLTYQAHHDALTGLPNRYALVTRLEAALQRLWGSPAHVAVLFCDLDGFKTLNDTLSHRAGDEELAGAAERLRGAVRPQDTVARLGGDEFVVIAEDVASPREAVDLGERLCASMRAPFRVGAREVGLSLSVGVSVTSDPRARSEDLLRQADLAMYRAKDNGRNRVEAYVETLEVAAVARMEIHERLRSALSAGEVRVEYQPIVALDGGGVSAVEALVRIPSPDAVTTAEYISAAQDSGLMAVLGTEILRLVLHDLCTWRAEGLDLRVHMNVTIGQLADHGFPESVFERVIGEGLPPGQVCIEVTDCPALQTDSDVTTSLTRLHDLGFRVGLDGFGAGRAGLASLKNLPTDYVKIDRSFIEGIATSTPDQVIVQAVVQVARELGRRVIATGVETSAQATVLRSLGCDEVQGYIHSAAVPADRIPDLVAAVR